VKLAVIFAAANAGAVLLVLSAGGGLEPILRPLLPSDDSSEVDVQVRAAPAIHPPVTDEVSASAQPDPAKAKPTRQDRPEEPEAEPERASLSAPPPAPPQPQPASPPSGKPAQPPPIEEPLPVIEEPAGDNGPVQPPAVIELPPAEPPPEITKPVEDDPGGVVTLDARGDDPNRGREDDQGQDRDGEDDDR
jgi:hypothetical protein